MLVNQQRVMTMSAARAAFTDVLDRAAEGAMTHLSRDGRICAHIVPEKALVIQGNELDVLMGAAIEEAANWLAQDAPKSGYFQAGDDIGRVFAWLWRCDPDQAVRFFSVYAHKVTNTFEAQGMTRPSLKVLAATLNVALGVCLTRDEAREFHEYIHPRLHEWYHPFSAEELEGGDRPRDDDDPWPDTTVYGKAFAKKRWRDITRQQFVANPDRAPELDIDVDSWCRVSRVEDATVFLTHYDGSTSTVSLGEAGDQFVPFQHYGPLKWPH
ncbi:Uncharacterised protein [Mycobacteroides abscessus subsp. abscessus]|uniref:hypothetical protein n=3 Tax=Mycobacteroides abscessus TaxID=36809 RepID=UPI000926FB5B|nr:hypothetical protein [Mycobacteroides abscessus]SHY28743.1 Uncharacterised protein [Mycobacteroides abscessus subsp. abscessus]SID71476.1 Uncharacterised protein [Mycobacteroides abscessus subsp. abscessus]SIK22803.1 Uncharacterised protein [Mycobacteroides abscessus subsp. abscessus]SIM54807.1 Uncharacterised protein [Mycobacteroides abscessus subsp. abscessus]SKL78901.1 Uncharacterised protein [Mycobacteroides abscessus subsp. massiliense]